MKIINESGLAFGPFAEQDCFQMECSPAFKKLGQYLKVAEFITRLKCPRQSLVIVEAKSSIPRDDQQFLQDINIKLINTLTLYLAAGLGRHAELQAELPTNLKQLDWQAANIKLYLVIPRVPDHQLAPLTDKFRKSLTISCKLWAIPEQDVWVLNERTAKKVGLVNCQNQ